MFFKLKGSAEIRERTKKIRASLLRVACSWCNDMALADDLVQEALTLALKKQHQLREVDKFESWMFSILNNCWRGHLRKLRETVDIDDVVLYEPRETEGNMLEMQIVDKVRLAISTLPNGQRQVVTLVDLQGFSYAEVAEILNIPVGTVMSRLNRARQALKEQLLSLKQELNINDKKLRSVK
ncbi:MAG: RNA polymerase sigma factor [Gammaproteobacteria bacterium]|nr:RNA polymerase sigma factor [Gammaproteobacteria bacterium]NNJ92631.1 RNA polymerase sigma factor [Gammaproteobacteria bacterium]